jgi:hypothetical protein
VRGCSLKISETLLDYVPKTVQ